MSTDASGAQMRRHSTLVAAGILLSRLSGLVRDAVLAFFLGANVGADAFRAALRIPNFLQNLLGEGVLSASFIPTFTRLVDDGRDEEAGKLAGAVLGLLIAAAGSLSLLGVVFARPLTVALTPGFTGERLELTVTLVRIMFPGIGLLVVSAWCLGILNSHRRFFLSYVAPVLWNTGILVVLLTLGATSVLDPAVAAGWGVVLGGLLQTAVQLPAVARLVGAHLRVSLDTRSPDVRQVLRAFGPIVFGRGVVQVAALLDLVIASLLAVGAVAVLGYAQTLYLLPIALFGMSVAVAELPTLSTMDPSARRALGSRLDHGLGRSSFFVVGVTVAYVMVGNAAIDLLFGRGQFDAATVFQVSAVLGVYAFGLVPATASRLLQSVLYSTDDAKTPAAVAVVRVVVALAIGIPLMFNLDQIVVDLAEPAGFRLADGGSLPTFSPVGAELREATSNQLRLGALGLAVGSVAGAWLEYALLRRVITRRFVAPRLAGGTGTRLAVAAGAAFLVMLLAGNLLTQRGPLVTLAVVGGLGGAAYLGTAWALRVPEARVMVASLTRSAPPGDGGP